MSVDIHAKLEVLPPYVGRYVFPIGRPIAGEDGAYHIVGEINSCGGTEEECKALAVLLTAAPDMLEALAEAERVIRWAAQESAGRVRSEIVMGWLHHAAKINNAIAKAEGRA